MTTAYPLQWPTGWPRTPATQQRSANFKAVGASRSGWSMHRALTLNEGVNRVLDEIRLFTKAGKTWRIDPDTVVISTNVPVRLDGLPRSGARAPEDTGVAVYWIENKAHRVMAIDQCTTVADNLAAVAATLDAMRAIERHGGARILERAFTGFTALPAPAAARSWREVIGVSTYVRDITIVRTEFRRRAAERHPDRPGGSHDAMTELNAALAAAEKELS